MNEKIAPKSIALPTTTAADARWRKWECRGCGFTIEGTTSLYFMRKAWSTYHIPAHYPNSLMAEIFVTSL